MTALSNKSVKKGVTFAVLTLFLVGCKTTPVSQVPVNCSCTDYFPSSPVDRQVYSNEVISDQIYQASGSAFCTGLKEVDVQTADKAAKENLAKLISVKVDSKESVKIGTTGYGVEIREYLQNSTLESKLTVQGAYIAQRWVDTDSCSIISSARVSTANAKLSLEALEQALPNSEFYIKTSNNDFIDTQLLSYFVEQGVKKVSAQDSQQKYLVTTNVLNVEQKNSKELTLTLQVQIIDREQDQVLTVLHAKGKGVTFKKLNSDELYKRAIDDALYELRPNFAKLLEQ